MSNNDYRYKLLIKMDIYTSKHELIKIYDTPFASGGEGEVREIVSAPAQYKGTCAKIYYQQKRTPQRAGKIKYMADNPPAKVKGDNFLIGWPLSISQTRMVHSWAF